MKSRRKKLTKIQASAKGEECTLQIFPYCNGNPETTVLCHGNSNDKGVGNKSPDWHGAYGCSDCHDVLDGRKKTDLDALEILKCFMRGQFRTMKRLIEKGLVWVEER